MNLYIKLTSFFLITLLLVSFAYAGYITIETNMKSQVKGNILNNEIEITNLGNEAAFNVRASLILNGSVYKSRIKEILGVGDSFKFNNSIEIPYSLKGTYPLITKVDYQDSNNYPFQALSASSFDFVNITTSNVEVRLESTKLSDKGTLNLLILNKDNKEKDIVVTVYAPEGIKVTDIPIKTKLENNLKLNFDLERINALSESNYAVFAIVEYDGNNKHFTSMGSSNVKIVDFIPNKNNIISKILIISFIALLLFYIFVKKKRLLN